MEKQTKKLNMRAKKVLVALATFFTCFMCNGCYVYASTNFGENIGNWFLDQLFWVALCILGFLFVGCLAKKAWVAAVIIFIGGAIILVIIKAPEQLYNIGLNLWNIVTNGTGTGE
ncbi:MAG: hypothetical protein IJ405_07185 [Lachnospiraceae bacterium]|nr:hypothetical protein [Lachnospiraceae bacterium]